MDDGEVPVVWIVEVARVVDVYYGLVGRSRSGGVGRVKQTGDVRSAGGWSVLVLSEHSVFERYGQEHDQKGGDEGDGGWRTEGRGGMERRGRSTYLYTGRVAQERGVGFKHGLRLYFHKRPTAISRLGISLGLLLFFEI